MNSCSTVAWFLPRWERILITLISLGAYGKKSILYIYIYINKINKKEPAMEPPDRPQGAEHQHAVCSMKRSVGIFVCLQVYVGMYNPFSSKFFKD